MLVRQVENLMSRPIRELLRFSACSIASAKALHVAAEDGVGAYADEPRPSTFERPSRNGAGPAVGRLARTFQRPVPCPPLRPLEQQPCR